MPTYSTWTATRRPWLARVETEEPRRRSVTPEAEASSHFARPDRAAFLSGQDSAFLPIPVVNEPSNDRAQSILLFRFWIIETATPCYVLRDIVGAQRP